MPVTFDEVHNAVPMHVPLEKQGITRNYLAKKLKAELNAKREIKSFDAEGNVRTLKVVDWPTRQRARQDAHKLMGDYPTEKGGAIMGTLNLRWADEGDDE